MPPLGIFAGRIIKRAHSDELLVVEPTKFEFIINLRAAKSLGSRFLAGCLLSPTRCLRLAVPYDGCRASGVKRK
jgi:hypothetical protein